MHVKNFLITYLRRQNFVISFLHNVGNTCYITLWKSCTRACEMEPFQLFVAVNVQFPIWASALRHLIWKLIYLIFRMLSSCWRHLLAKHWILCSLEEKNFLNWSTVMYKTLLIFDVFSRDYLRPKHIHKRSVCPSESEETFSTYVSGCQKVLN